VSLSCAVRISMCHPNVVSLMIEIRKIPPCLHAVQFMTRCLTLASGSLSLTAAMSWSRWLFVLSVLSVVIGAYGGRDGFSAQNLTGYGRSRMLSSKYQLLWDGDAEWIHVAMVVETQGWVAIGIAEPTSGRFVTLAWDV